MNIYLSATEVTSKKLFVHFELHFVTLNSNMSVLIVQS